MAKKLILDTDELVKVRKELAFQIKQKDQLINELIVANNERLIQNKFKEKSVKELFIANKNLLFQEIEKDEKEVIKRELEVLNDTIKLDSQYSRSLLEASLDPLVTISVDGKIMDVNEASIQVTGVSREKLIGTDFSSYFTEPTKAQAGYLQVFDKGFVSDYPLTIKNIGGNLTDVLYNASVYKDDKGKVLGVFAAARDVTKQNLLSNYSLSLIEASRDPLFTINKLGKITDVNNASVKITNLSKDKLLGSNFINYFTEPDKARQGYEEIFSQGFIADYPLTILDNNYTPVLFNGSVYKDDRGNILGAVVVARVITEQKRFEKELMEARLFAEQATIIAEMATKNAEDSVKAKQQFLSNMSHEIRTPMNAIIGFTKVALKTELTLKQREYLNAIKLSGDAMIILINDILDLAKVDSGKMSFDKIPFKLEASISSMLHLFETKIQEKNLLLELHYDHQIPKVLIGDPLRLHQIILNLVSNAVKFTNNGKITVSVQLKSEDNDRVNIEFMVIDTGIGILDSKLDLIFENFQQASSNTSKLFGGTGLGLAIAKKLVEFQEGEIQVKSVINEGSTFTFTLPFIKTNEQLEVEIENFEIISEIKNIKVLVVEDIVLNQLLMKTLLDDFGFERDIAANGKIAIEKLESKLYDIILMDLQMPVMNGFETTDYIRNTLHSKIPIIALTADVTTTDIDKCKAAGMNDYIAKPIDEKILYKKIVSLVIKKVNKPTSLKSRNTSENVVTRFTDLTYIKKITKSNSALIAEMIESYLEQTPNLLLAINNSYQNKEWDMLHAAVHKMIPSFSIIGMNKEYELIAHKVQEYATALERTEGISELILQLEEACKQACNELTEELNKLKTTHE